VLMDPCAKRRQHQEAISQEAYLTARKISKRRIQMTSPQREKGMVLTTKGKNIALPVDK